MKWLGVATVIATTLISANAFSATGGVRPMPTDLQKAANCMFGILKKEPGFEEIRLRVFEDEGFVLPYVQYRSPADKLGRRITVAFQAELSCTTVNRSYNCCQAKDRYCFIALLDGLVGQGEPGPADGDVQVVMDKWNAQCGVEATALFT